MITEIRCPNRECAGYLKVVDGKLDEHFITHTVSGFDPEGSTQLGQAYLGSRRPILRVRRKCEWSGADVMTDHLINPERRAP